MDYQNFSSSPAAQQVFTAAVADSISNFNESYVNINEITNLSPVPASSSVFVVLSTVSSTAAAAQLQSAANDILIKYTLQFYIEAVGYHDANFALNDVLKQLNASIHSGHFMNSLLFYANQHNLLALFQDCQPGSLSFLSAQVNSLHGSSSNDTGFYQPWDLYAKVLFLIGGAIVLLLMVCIAQYFARKSIRSNPLAGIRSSLMTRQDFIRRLNLTRATTNTTTTTINNPALDKGDPNALEGATNANGQGVEQNFVNFILNDDFFMMQSSRESAGGAEGK
jgi:hypothetical protein